MFGSSQALYFYCLLYFFFQAEDGIRDLVRSRGLGDVYKRQVLSLLSKNRTMFNKRIKIKELLSQEPQGQEVIVMGWVRTFRNNQFIALNDGSTNNNLQVVVELGKFDDELLKRITTSASLKVTGIIEASLGKGQKMDLKAVTIEVLGDSDAEKYPLQPKKHSLEFLREKAHLRFRTNTFGSVFRVRHALAFAVHKFFNDKGFLYMHTPIITASDAEGAGEMFKVTTLPVDGSASRDDEGKVDFKEDFFGRATNLTVSGQLEGELGATAFGDIYTFGPTFRAENSNTARHLAEFWMIEPEMAFYDLEDNANLAEEFIQYLIKYVIDNNKEDLEFLAQRLAEEEKQLPQDKRCLLYTSDAADERSSVDLGGRRIIKKKRTHRVMVYHTSKSKRANLILSIYTTTSYSL